MNQSTRLDTRNRMGTGRLAALLNRPQTDAGRPEEASPTVSFSGASSVSSRSFRVAVLPIVRKHAHATRTGERSGLIVSSVSPANNLNSGAKSHHPCGLVHHKRLFFIKNKHQFCTSAVHLFSIKESTVVYVHSVLKQSTNYRVQTRQKVCVQT
jgi:hypothetical protein